MSCKCDTPIEEREVDPFEIEQKAKNHLKDLRTVQTSAKDPESHLRGVDLLLRAIVTSSLGKSRLRVEVSFKIITDKYSSTHL